MSELLKGATLTAAIADRLYDRGGRSVPGAGVFRMELLPAYAVASDGGDFGRYLEGEAEPDWERKRPFMARLEQRRDDGLYQRRVRILSAMLSDYERFECDWAYRLNVPCGEDIRVLHRGEHDVPSLLGFDYWLVNDSTVLRMHYANDGKFQGAQEAPELLRVCRREARHTFREAEPFLQWWERHPEIAARRKVT